MFKSDFNFRLPKYLIAKYPSERRTDCRMLFLDGHFGKRFDCQFCDILDIIKPGDLLVFNDTKVIPARLYGNKETGGAFEILIERLIDDHKASVHLKCSKSPQQGAKLLFDKGYEATMVGREGDLFIIEFTCDKKILDILDEIGHVPLPPYIDRPDENADKERYQTVYSREPGAVAAPTAGLHFDDSILDLIRLKGADIAFVTLHVGAGTFQPVREEDIHKHHMHSEYARLTQEVVDKIHEAKARGGKIIAVGTTSVRTLESAACASLEQGKFLAPFEGYTSIFIYPGYKFKLVDALVTNFHLPESTLIMLVCALAGYTNTMSAYRYAVKNKYKFFSYGDAMYVTKNKYAETEAEIDKKFKRI